MFVTCGEEKNLINYGILFLFLQAKRMSRSALIKIVRSIAGDKLVGDSIKSKQTQSMGEAVVQSLLVSEKGEVVNNTFIP